jgi:hypothetical protein
MNVTSVDGETLMVHNGDVSLAISGLPLDHIGASIRRRPACPTPRGLLQVAGRASRSAYSAVLSKPVQIVVPTRERLLSPDTS